LAGVSLSDVPVTLSEATTGSFGHRSLAGNLGAAVLDRFRIVFDYQARTVTFYPEPGVQKPFRRNLSGMSISQARPDALDVLSVREGSPAFAAGTRAGDRIIVVNGKNVGEYELGVYDLLPLLEHQSKVTLRLVRDDKPYDIVLSLDE
jgi:S1-C subfamily serine protease